MAGRKASPKTQAETNIWAKNSIPALEYCNLHRATELLNCQLNDLLHFAEIGAIELCLKFNGFKASVKHVEDSLEYHDNPEKWLQNCISKGYFNNYYKNQNSQLSKVIVQQELKSIINEDIDSEHIAYFENKSLYLTCHIFGLWGLGTTYHSNLYSSLQSSGQAQVTALNLQLHTSDEDSIIKSRVVIPLPTDLYDDCGALIHPAPALFMITPSDLFITRKQIEKIYNHTAKLLPNYINGGVINPPEPDLPIAVDNVDINLNKNMLGDLLNMLIGAVLELGPMAAKASINKKSELLEAFVADKKAKGELPDYKLPGKDTLRKYFTN